LDVRINGDALVEGDSIRLGQVLYNLLSNAAKFSPEETPIALTSEVSGGCVRIAVADKGRGIPAEHFPRLFERFYRVPSERATVPQGFGLRSGAGGLCKR
jgi:two-component system phosphate regulon sensor histidine kinase PhoR